MAKRKSRIQIGKTVTVKGKKYRIARGTAKGKKYKAVPVSGKGKTHHFGAKGYTIRPGTEQGHNYCARSSGIQSKQKGAIPNDFSRLGWNCRGKRSLKR